MFWFSLLLAIAGTLSTINGFLLVVRFAFVNGH
jgi:hypothetical protein